MGCTGSAKRIEPGVRLALALGAAAHVSGAEIRLVEACESERFAERCLDHRDKGENPLHPGRQFGSFAGVR